MGADVLRTLTGGLIAGRSAAAEAEKPRSGKQEADDPDRDPDPWNDEEKDDPDDEQR
jgi:hypothetical protein